MTWSRARTGRHGQFFTPKDREKRMDDVGLLWQAQGQPRFGRGVWIAAGFEFVFERPPSHYGTGRNRHLVKASAPAYPGLGKNGGDLDNLVKLMKDALNTIAYHDDSQIVEMDFERKRWAKPGEHPHTLIRLRALL